MQKLCEKIRDELRDIGETEDLPTEMVRISQEIASISLASFRDELLRKALCISRAIADFDCEMRYGSQK